MRCPRKALPLRKQLSVEYESTRHAEMRGEGEVLRCPGIMGRVWGVGEVSNHHKVGTGVRLEVHGLQGIMELALLICERMWVSCKGAFFLETGLYCGQLGGQGVG